MPIAQEIKSDVNITKVTITVINNGTSYLFQIQVRQTENKIDMKKLIS